MVYNSTIKQPPSGHYILGIPAGSVVTNCSNYLASTWNPPNFPLPIHPIFLSSSILFHSVQYILWVHWKCPINSPPNSSPPHLHSTYSLSLPPLHPHSTSYIISGALCMTRILRFVLWQYVTPANWFNFIFTRSQRGAWHFLPIVIQPIRAHVVRVKLN